MATRKDLIKSIFFDEIINEAKNGEVKAKLDGEDYTFNVGFNSCIEGVLSSGNFGDSKPILMVNNREQLINLFEQYINECEKNDKVFNNCDLKTRIKIYLTLIWSNATYEDFANPLSFVARRIDFFQNNLFDFASHEYGKDIEVLDNSDIIVFNEMQDIRMETPYVFKPIVTKGDEVFSLPCISYGVSNGEVFIYAIQNKQKDELTSYGKKINRRLYKINAGVSENESDEYKEFMNGNDYYPENISDVSPSAILSLSIFLDMVNQYGMEKIKVISLLPIRYNSKELAFTKKYEFKLKNDHLNSKELEKLLLEYKKEHLRIQQNLTEKLIRDFRRIEYHFKNCVITSYPMEFDEYLHMIVKEFKLSDNLFLNEIIGKRQISK